MVKVKKAGIALHGLPGDSVKTFPCTLPGMRVFFYWAAEGDPDKVYTQGEIPHYLNHPSALVETPVK